LLLKLEHSYWLLALSILPALPGFHYREGKIKQATIFFHNPNLKHNILTSIILSTPLEIVEIIFEKIC